MKIQDIGFIAVLATILLLRKPKLFVFTALLFLLLSIPLFYFQVFFTAERLTWYAGGLFLLYVINEL